MPTLLAGGKATAWPRHHAPPLPRLTALLSIVVSYSQVSALFFVLESAVKAVEAVTGPQLVELL